jgi:hypothetical protein
MAVLNIPVVREQRANLPTAVEARFPDADPKAHDPRAELLAVVQPRTEPATRGVAAAAVGKPQQTLFAPVERRA